MLKNCIRQKKYADWSVEKIQSEEQKESGNMNRAKGTSSVYPQMNNGKERRQKGLERRAEEVMAQIS